MAQPDTNEDSLFLRNNFKGCNEIEYVMIGKRLVTLNNGDYYKKYGKMLTRDLSSVSSFSLLTKLVGHKEFVLDVGCGIGYMSRLFPNYVGVDVKQEALKTAKRFFHDKDFVLASGTALPFRSGYFSTSFAYDCVEHVSDVPSFLCEMRRISSKCVLGCIDFKSWYQVITRTLRNDPTHIYEPSRKQLIQMIRKHMKINKTYSTCGIFYLPGKLNRFFARYLPEYVMVECHNE